MPLNPLFFWPLAQASPSSQGGSSSWDPNPPSPTHMLSWDKQQFHLFLSCCYSHQGGGQDHAWTLFRFPISIYWG